MRKLTLKSPNMWQTLHFKDNAEKLFSVGRKVAFGERGAALITIKSHENIKDSSLSWAPAADQNKLKVCKRQQQQQGGYWSRARGWNICTPATYTHLYTSFLFKLRQTEDKQKQVTAKSQNTEKNKESTLRSHQATSRSTAGRFRNKPWSLSTKEELSEQMLKVNLHFLSATINFQDVFFFLLVLLLISYQNKVWETFSQKTVKMPKVKYSTCCFACSVKNTNIFSLII